MCVQCYNSAILPTDQGVPGLSIGGNITIRILPSDDAFGVFSFAADSLSRLVSEQDGGTAVTLNVGRLGGTFDDVSVYWEVEGGDGGDISPTSGRLDFSEGETEGELTVTINNDEVHIPCLGSVVGSSPGTAISCAIGMHLPCVCCTKFCWVQKLNYLRGRKSLTTLAGLAIYKAYNYMLLVIGHFLRPQNWRKHYPYVW